MIERAINWNWNQASTDWNWTSTFYEWIFKRKTIKFNVAFYEWNTFHSLNNTNGTFRGAQQYFCNQPTQNLAHQLKLYSVPSIITYRQYVGCTQIWLYQLNCEAFHRQLKWHAHIWHTYNKTQQKQRMYNKHCSRGFSLHSFSHIPPTSGSYRSSNPNIKRHLFNNISIIIFYRNVLFVLCYIWIFERIFIDSMRQSVYVYVCVCSCCDLGWRISRRK